MSPESSLPTVAATALALALALAGARTARAEDEALPAGEEIARRINARSDGTSLASDLTMELVDSRGTRRVREIRTLRRDLEGERQTLFVFDLPKDVKGTGLLVHDYRTSEREDQQWLYLPATRKVRRIASGDRGGAFAGTDFSYDDMKNGSKVNLGDYRWTTLRRDALEGAPCYVIQADAVSAAVAEELGYGRIVFWVDAALWMARRSEITDSRGQPLKTIETRDIRAVNGIWTAHSLEVRNQQTGHRTVLAVKRVEYDLPVAADTFTERALERGLVPRP